MNARLAFHTLLLSMFSAAELRRFVTYRLPDGSSLVNSLPAGGVSLANLADAVIDLLERTGNLDHALFDSLIAERPGRADEILAVRDRLQADGFLQSGPVPAHGTNPPPGDGWNFFLAHASADKPTVRQFYEELRRQRPDMRVFYDEASLSPGDIWTAEIPRALTASKIVLVFISTRTSQGWFASDEVQQAIDLMRNGVLRIIPVYLDGFGTDDIPYGLRTIQGVDAQRRPVEAIVKDLVHVASA